ncbi:hypothetical protein [Moraxella sp.]|uniref:hypothetical protein n=1 Tax=Moraxella sp. TaxID=479 RepID=UPI0026DC78D2|nr:hypothetical protein [Moraxella sp.]MDO4895655.1 hypothetical protein [Moraxella sp.]
MNANLKCYDADTGRVIFDLSQNPARILVTLTLQPYQKGVYEHTGGGTLFGYFIENQEHSDWSEIENIEQSTIKVEQNRLKYQCSSSPSTLIIGVIGGN